jgi:hypothetical protein
MLDNLYFIDPCLKQLYVILMDKIQGRSDLILAGQASDYAEYKKMTGYLEAMRDVIEICKDVEQDRYGLKSTSDRKELLD